MPYTIFTYIMRNTIYFMLETISFECLAVWQWGKPCRRPQKIQSFHGHFLARDWSNFCSCGHLFAAVWLVCLHVFIFDALADQLGESLLWGQVASTWDAGTLRIDDAGWHATSMGQRIAWATVSGSAALHPTGKSSGPVRIIEDWRCFIFLDGRHMLRMLEM